MASLEGHSTVVYKDTMYIFGGVDHRTGLLSNCTWSIKMAEILDNSASLDTRGTQTVTLNLVRCRGHFPPPRCYHSCTLRGPFMVVNGGETGTDDDAKGRRMHQLNQYHAAGVSALGNEISLFDDGDDDVVSNDSDEDEAPQPKSKAMAQTERVKRGLIIYTLNLETLLWSRHSLQYSFESHDGWVLRAQQTLKKLQVQQQTAATYQGSGRNGGPTIDASNLIRLNQQALLEAGGSVRVGKGTSIIADDKAGALALAQATDTVVEAAGLSFTDMALAAVKRRCHATMLSCSETILLFGGYPIERSTTSQGGLKAQSMFDGEAASLHQAEYNSLMPGNSKVTYDGTGGGLLRPSSPRSKRLGGVNHRDEATTVEPTCFYRLFEISGQVDISAVNSVGSVPMLWGHTAVRCHNSIIVFGGVDARGGSETAALCVYSLEDKRWRWVDQNLSVTNHPAMGEHKSEETGPTPGALHSAVVHRATMIVHGGFNTSDPTSTTATIRPSITNEHMNDTWVFSLNTGQWELWECGGEVAVPRSGHSSLMFEDFMVVVGGLETKVAPPQMDFPPPTLGHDSRPKADGSSPSTFTIAVLDTNERVWRVKEVKTNVPMEEALRSFVMPKGANEAKTTSDDAIFSGRAGLLLNPFPLHPFTNAANKDSNPAPTSAPITKPPTFEVTRRASIAPEVITPASVPENPAVTWQEVPQSWQDAPKQSTSTLVPPPSFFGPGSFNPFAFTSPERTEPWAHHKSAALPSVSESPRPTRLNTTKPLSFHQFSAQKKQAIPTTVYELDDDELPKSQRPSQTVRSGPDTSHNVSIPLSHTSRASTPQGEERKERLRQMRRRQSSQHGDSSRASATTSQPPSALTTPIATNADTDSMYTRIREPKISRTPQLESADTDRRPPRASVDASRTNEAGAKDQLMKPKPKAKSLTNRPEWNARTSTPKKVKEPETKKAPTKIIRTDSESTISTTRQVVADKRRPKALSSAEPSHQKGDFLTETDDDSLTEETQSATATVAKLLAEELLKLQQIQTVQQEKQFELQKRQMRLMECLAPTDSVAAYSTPPSGYLPIGSQPYQSFQPQVTPHPFSHSTADPSYPRAETLLYNPYRKSQSSPGYGLDGGYSGYMSNTANALPRQGGIAYSDPQYTAAREQFLAALQ